MTAAQPREATLEDVPELVRVINLAYRVEDFFISGDRTDPDDMRERLGRRDALFLVLDAAAAGRLAAAVYVELRGAVGYFGLLSVDPEVQRRGIARRLVAAVEQCCRDRGCTEIEIEVVNLRSELPAFYGALGYRTIGRAVFRDAHKLKLPAEMVVMRKALGPAA